MQINASYSYGSTGRIVENMHRLLLEKRYESYVGFGRGPKASAYGTVRIGEKRDVLLHGIMSRLFDNHGFGSKNATAEFITRMERVRPDIVHLHNLHGYYINVEHIFDYIRKRNPQVIWTFHDCWPFTGHCSHFEFYNCLRWRKECFQCPNKKGYPKSWWKDNSKVNFHNKKRLFTGINKMVLVSPSKWLRNHLKNSFLKDYQVEVIRNGIDLEKFKIVDAYRIRKKYKIPEGSFIIGVASTWTNRKGLNDFVIFRNIFGHEANIVLVGLDKRQLKKMPAGIIGIGRTQNVEDLAGLYSAADAFVNPTWVDNFPTTNIEALACGTPVVTYNTGGSPEAIDEHTGMVVPKGDIEGLTAAVRVVLENGKDTYSQKCRERAELLFDSRRRYQDYIDLYMRMIDKQEDLYV